MLTCANRQSLWIPAALAVLTLAAETAAAPKDRGMNRGSDQAAYCVREHGGDPACCERGAARNIKRSCCSDGADGESSGADLACAGGSDEETWQERGFESLRECGETADEHLDQCLSILYKHFEQEEQEEQPEALESAEAPGMVPGEEQAAECLLGTGAQECCGRGYDTNVVRACCSEGANAQAPGPDLVCAGGAGNEIWEESGFESLQDCEYRATEHFNGCLRALEAAN